MCQWCNISVFSCVSAFDKAESVAAICAKLHPKLPMIGIIIGVRLIFDRLNG
jgi:hypothetical protein